MCLRTWGDEDVIPNIGFALLAHMACQCILSSQSCVESLHTVILNCLPTLLPCSAVLKALNSTSPEGSDSLTSSWTGLVSKRLVWFFG